MATEIIVALISGAVTLTVGLLTLLGVLVQNRRHNRDISELIEYRITQLEKKQDKHNNLIERMMAVEGSINVLQAQQADMKEDIQRLESLKGA